MDYTKEALMNEINHLHKENELLNKVILEIFENLHGDGCAEFPYKTYNCHLSRKECAQKWSKIYIEDAR